MARTLAARRHVARLSFEDGQVIVTPKDRSLFMISAEKAVEACEDMVRREEGIQRFETEFLIPLNKWCADHASQVRACYLPLPTAHIQVFIVTTSAQFDFDLAEEMAKLELGLAQCGWRVGVSQLPKTDTASLATFFNPDGALEIYAQR